MRRTRLRVPAEDLSLLEVPPLSDWPHLASENRQSVEATVFDLPLKSLRSQARRETLAKIRDYLSEWGQSAEDDVPDAGAESGPWIVTGHQPELFHPGVWIKNFAAYHLARQVGGLSLNLIVDNDVLKATAIRAPAGTPESPLLANIPFDQFDGEIPYEERPIVDPEVFDRFGPEVEREMAGYGFRPLVRRLWKEAKRARQRSDNLGEVLSAARRQVERRMGVRNLELPLSRLCETGSFRLFVAGLLLDAKNFAGTHNDSLFRYRRQNGIRSKNHPVPELTADGDWTETPFWTWTASEPVRRPLFVRPSQQRLQLRAGDRLIAELSAESLQACADALGTLREWKIRPRALSNTMFARLFLADLFIHGVGGGKYDELTDLLVQRHFGLTAPGYAILSATALIGKPSNNALSDLRRLQRQKRDLDWNPDRYLPEHLRDLDPALSWIERKHELMETSGQTRMERTRRFREFRRLNENLRRLLGPLPAEIDRQIVDAKQYLRTAQLLGSREFSYVVHSEEKLASLFDLADRFSASAGLEQNGAQNTLKSEVDLLKTRS